MRSGNEVCKERSRQAIEPPSPVAQLIRTARLDQPELIVDMNKLTLRGSLNGRGENVSDVSES